MSEILKVNAKTSTLEWKRKFNKLVERSVVKIETSNIEQLTDEQLSSLKVGDVVRKKTGNQEHCYIVTYKEENHGICLSYFAAGYTETISYDFTNNHWIFNSKDVVETQPKLVSGTNIKTIGGQSILGSGDLPISGGTQLYEHTLTISNLSPYTGNVVLKTEAGNIRKLKIINKANAEINTTSKLVTAISSKVAINNILLDNDDNKYLILLGNDINIYLLKLNDNSIISISAGFSSGSVSDEVTKL